MQNVRDKYYVQVVLNFESKHILYVLQMYNDL